MAYYEIQTYTLCDGWVNTWNIVDTEGHEWPVTFRTRKEAEDELEGYLEELREAVEWGELEDYSPEDHRVAYIDE